MQLHGKSVTISAPPATPLRDSTMTVPTPAPRYLQAYADTWKHSPRQANLQWFTDAGFGLFMHYGLYSQLARHEWVQHIEKIPVAEYAKLFDTFDPRNFDADFITDLALDAGMKYINITSCHHEGFCLWNSSREMFNSYQACRRDLVRELAAQCDKKGLGFFTYFTYVLNWRHPYSMTNAMLNMARPAYDPPDPHYLLTEPDQLHHFWEWSHGCISELAQLDYPLAGIWLDIIMGYYQRPHDIPVKETYALIRKLRPEALIAFKQGATGDEDFAAPEFRFHSMADRLTQLGNTEGAEIARRAWEINRHKHNEICMTLQERGWGYTKDSPHKNADALWQALAYARGNNCNLLANTGPLPDGSIHPEDVATLREVGRRIRTQGLPDPVETQTQTPQANTGAGLA